MFKVFYIGLLLVMITLFSCKNPTANVAQVKQDSTHSCMKVPSRFGEPVNATDRLVSGDTSTKGMVFIPGGTFDMGGDNKPPHRNSLPVQPGNFLFLLYCFPALPGVSSRHLLPNSTIVCNRLNQRVR